MSSFSLAMAAATALLLAAPAVAQDHAHDHAPAAGVVAAEAVAATVVVDAFHAALKRGDSDEALTWLAPGVMIFEEGGAERSRDEYRSHHLGADAAFSAATSATVSRRSAWASGDVAWVTSEGHTTGRFNGREVDRLTVETMVLRRSGEGWRIHHIHWSSRAPR